MQPDSMELDAEEEGGPTHDVRRPSREFDGRLERQRGSWLIPQSAYNHSTDVNDKLLLEVQ